MNSADEILKNAADSFAAITKISDDVEKAAAFSTSSDIFVMAAKLSAAFFSISSAEFILLYLLLSSGTFILPTCALRSTFCEDQIIDSNITKFIKSSILKDGFFFLFFVTPK